MPSEDLQNTPPTAQTERGMGGAVSKEEEAWVQLGHDAYHSSTSYVDNNLRKKWEDGLRAFNSQHTTDSKFNSTVFEKRSHLYRPKIRTIVRKNEAASAAAFFSNMDTASVEAPDPNNKRGQAGAEVMKQLLQYRTTKSLKWFHVVQGGFQDAQNTGVVCAHVYWEYEAAKPEAIIKIKEPDDMQQGEEEYPHQSSLPEGAFSVEAEPVEIDISLPVVEQGEDSKKPLGLESAIQPQEASTAPQAPSAQGQEMPKMVGNQPPLAADQGLPEQPVLQIKPRKGPKPLVDKPTIDILPAENLRIDPAANWMDPVNSSPFIIHLIPMYYMDVRAKMESGEWRSYGGAYIRAAAETKYDSTRSIRAQAEDVYQKSNNDADDYTICWVHRHIHRKDGVDWEFYMLSDFALLTEPRPLKDTVFHGKRPYVMGCCILEAHKAYPSTFYAVGKNLVDEANEIANQRIDNVKFVLNKKYLVKRGGNQDLAGLVRNVPGGVVMMDDPQTDVKELTWPDVTASSYEEQTRIDNDLNDLLGNFSAAQVMADHGVNGPAHNMAMLGQSAGTLTEYTIRTYVETFVQPLLRLLVLLEQHYETDEVVIALASKKASLFQKFGIDEVTDDLLDQELTLNVNVGMGATDPQLKVQKFMAAVTMYANVAKEPPLGLNMQEVGKELFGHLGYSDGSRFFTNDNPQVAQLQQQVQQLTMLVKQLKAGHDVKIMGHQVKLQTNEATNRTKLQIAGKHEDAENLRSATAHKVSLVDAEKDRVHQLVMKRLETAEKRVDHVRGVQMGLSNGKSK